MKNICVFCGSGRGNNPDYLLAANELGKEIVKHDLRLVYGGGNIGLMGAVADSVLGAGGKVTGVIPKFLMEKEVGHEGLSELIITDSMHERKTEMAKISDAFIAMPGGLGTLEELAEISTWVQLELMKKPIGILNVNGFYDPLLKMLDTMVDQGFLMKGNRVNIVSNQKPDELIKEILSFEFNDFSIWNELKKDLT